MATTQIPLELDRSRREPLSEQLAQQLRDAIQHGRLPAERDRSSLLAVRAVVMATDPAARTVLLAPD